MNNTGSPNHEAPSELPFQFGWPRTRPAVSSCRSATRTGLALALAASLHLVQSPRLRGEDHVDYKYEDYNEENGRIHIRTHSALIETSLAPWLNLKGEYVYDGISGATPVGTPALPGTDQVQLSQIEDIRRAGYVEPSFHFGRHTLTPQLAYSKESDYESIGVSLNYAIDLNQKNTTLVFGIAHNFDTIMPKFWAPQREHKDSTDFLVGITQILGPRSLVTANLTLGTSNGYLSDPYKRVVFDGLQITDPNDPSYDPTFYYLLPENRPGHKTKQVVFVSFSQFVDPLNASAEVSYRFYHDSFAIFSHTASLEWHQKIGKHLIVSPLFRYYTQTAAYFYATHFAGNPQDPESYPDVVIPQFYSADYRLAALTSLTYGAQATVILHRGVNLDLAYKRYEMSGNDGVTSASNFPKANVFTAGLRVWF